MKVAHRNSLSDHLGKDGKITPERDKVHRRMMDRTMNGKTPRPKTEKATITFLGGGSASGKGHLSAKTNGEVDRHTVIIDPDEYKKWLPGYSHKVIEDGEKKDRGLSRWTKRAAEFYHEESSALAKRMLKKALEDNYDTVYDGTGDGTWKSMLKKIQQAREAGYTVNGEYATVEVEEALKRNKERDDRLVASGEPSRLPPEDRVRKIHKNVSDVAIQIAPAYDDLKIYDNNVPFGSPMVLIATGGNGKYLKPVKGQEEAFKRFCAKGSIEFVTLPDGTVVPVDKVI